MQLTDEQWHAVEPYIPEEERRAPGKRGGRPWISAPQVLDGVLWVLRMGAPWSGLPWRFPPYQTCHRRFQRSLEAGVLPNVLAALQRDLDVRNAKETWGRSHRDWLTARMQLAIPFEGRL